MKTEKTMKLKKITFVSVIVAIAVATVMLVSMFWLKAVARAATDKDANNSQVEQTIMQIEILEAEYQRSFDENHRSRSGKDGRQKTSDCRNLL